MVRNIRIILATYLALMSLCSCTMCTLHLPFSSPELRILSYNVENLFDDRDAGTEYSDYDPGSSEWDTPLYHAKLKNIAEVLNSVAGGADICLLQEVENQRVVTDLMEGYLNVLRYRHAVTAPAPTATTVAILSKYPPQRSYSHAICDAYGPPMRPVLETHFTIRKTSLVVFTMHWKSKSGGARETEQYRRLAADFVAARAGELLTDDPDLTIVAAGDLNENVDEYSRVNGEYPTALMIYPGSHNTNAGHIQITGQPGQSGFYNGNLLFYSPWIESAEQGSYLYRGEWESIDHFLIAGLGGSVIFRDFEIAAHPWMLDSSGGPKRWNTATAGGYSDHLPIILTLGI